MQHSGFSLWQLPALLYLPFALTACSSGSSDDGANTDTDTAPAPQAIALLGEEELTLEAGDTYTEAGALAFGSDGNGGASNIAISGEVDTLRPGTYEILYTIANSADNTGAALRTVHVQDTTPPTLTLNGDAVVTLEAGDEYIEHGVLAQDIASKDDQITLTTNGSVNIRQPDSYTITYTATDGAGNVATATRTVRVQDTVPPNMTLRGSTLITLQAGTAYVEHGARAYDIVDRWVNVAILDTINDRAIGTHKVRYRVTDRAGNTAQLTRIVKIIDTLPPHIVLNGEATMTIEAGNAFNDPGAEATDNADGRRPVVASGEVKTRVPGTYTRLYKSTDKSGYTATATRTIKVQDTRAPVITLNGDTTMTVEAGTPYTEQGATASDTLDGDLAVTITGEVDTSRVGSYTRSYQSTDNAGNTRTVKRRIKVRDTIPPIITLSGAKIITLEAGANYTDQGATASDNIDGTLMVSPSSNVDPNKVGSYTIRYRAADRSGNTAAVTRTVHVRDTTAPTIVVNGDKAITIEAGIDYIDAGIQVQDMGDASPAIVVSGTVDTMATGSYAITYTVTDQSGNTASATRIVTVQDTTPPVITLSGDTQARIKLGTDYTMVKPYTVPTATAKDAFDGEVAVTTTGTVDTTQLGHYEIHYHATDRAGNSQTATHKVEVFYAPFVTTWQTDRGSEHTTSGRNQISFRVHEGDVNFTVNWGDGTVETIDQLNHHLRLVTHTYAKPGIYTVAIEGTFPGMNHQDGLGDPGKLLSIEQWGSIEWSTMAHTLAYTDYVSLPTADTPDLRQVNSMANMFQYASVYSIVFHHMNQWKMSNIKDMSYLFNETLISIDDYLENDHQLANSYEHYHLHNNDDNAYACYQKSETELFYDYYLDLSQWDVSGVTSMKSMFKNLSFDTSYTSIYYIDEPYIYFDTKPWDVSSVIDMSHMFSGIDFYVDSELCQWDVSKVTNMSHMFRDVESADGIDLSQWDVSAVTDMSSMFYDAAYFDLSQWNLDSVIDMSSMFNRASNFNIGQWTLSAVTNMSYMFAQAYNFDHNSISHWDVSSVTNMTGMFNRSNFNGDISQWDVSNVTNMASMFGISNFNGDISQWDVSNVTNMNAMFRYAKAFNGDISQWDVSSVTKMYSMFEYAETFNGDISQWNVSSVTDMSLMFRYAKAFNGDISQWDVSSVTDMRAMFKDATLFNGRISQWDISSVRNINDLFSGLQLSPEHYDDLLNAWSKLPPPRFLDFSAGNSRYSEAGRAARQILIDDFHWDIEDGGRYGE